MNASTFPNPSSNWKLPMNFAKVPSSLDTYGGLVSTVSGCLFLVSFSSLGVPIFPCTDSNPSRGPGNSTCC